MTRRQGFDSRQRGSDPQREGFDPARRLVDLANLFRDDPEATVDRVKRVLAEHGETPEELVGLTADDVTRLRRAGGEFIDILSTETADIAATALNGVLRRSGAQPRLSNHDGHFWHLHVDREGSDWGDWLAASGALALAQLLSQRGRIAWGSCAATECGRFFLDTGPGSARRYCSSACATRARVREHRAKKNDRQLPIHSGVIALRGPDGVDRCAI
ncbi:putative stress-induced transcription regulator [Stackebrandtia endophytica]|uniref:Putative stress-induced transcription regulator n=1 Tax=Stackebrandtia endophytica TaxID=1496996 RepID=A0A543ARN7_9ACTN|nr:CGNR zinc finger domain-containing protein [Stackebrandtia endophytica]TQL75243.1 putative stress-induced transcription regulator [Stackebrandtia endophytica]